MESYINYIAVYNENLEVRYVELKKGLNIISGLSKTGKSALLEIIDYCLCSKHCTIPSGVISDFSRYYSIVLTIENEKFLVLRKTPLEKGKMYFNKVEKDYNPTLLNSELLNTFIFKPYSDIQRELELTLGLQVENIEVDGDKKKKASLRNMVSYLFQHQNLIASKFALFYRFNDIYKRKDALEQFPIFSGILNQEYYSLLIEKNKLENKIKLLNKSKRISEKNEELIIRKLKPVFDDYCALIGQESPRIAKMKDLLFYCRNLPIYDDSGYYDNANITARLKELRNKYYELQDEERKIDLCLKNITDTTDNGKKYIKSIDEIYSKASFKLLQGTCNDATCPLCNQPVETKENILECVIKEIDDEKIKVTHDFERFPEEIRKLNEKKATVVKEIKYVYKQIKTLEKESSIDKNQKDKIESLRYKIQAFVELINNKEFDLVDEDEENIRKRLSEINKSLRMYDYENKIKDALGFINQRMNQIASKLDFEDEYKPIDLHFSIDNGDYDFYLMNNGDEVHLEEMGSGANWISCHISLFMSLLSYFCKEEKSCILKTVFFDQPSQVYFATDENPNDLTSVDNIFRTIRDEIDRIYSETGVKPQVIIVDHVIEKEFEEYQRAKWFDGEAFI